MSASPADDSPKIAALIVAGGQGLRLGGEVPKQYQMIGSGAVLARTANAFLAHPSVDLVQVVIGADDQNHYEALGLIHDKLLPAKPGGASRQASVAAGLDAIQNYEPDLVLIHDAARPFVDTALIQRLISALEIHDGAFLAVPVADTLRRKSPTSAALETIDRADLWQAQTPQAFRYAKILAAHAQAQGDETDDVALAEQAGLKVKLVEGSRRNFKITTPADLEMARQLVKEDGGSTTETRVGFGYDVHRFEPGEAVTLCGVDIPFHQKLKGHSDADVGLHAITDALLGAIGAGDIGTHFPPSDENWKDTDSSVFLRHAGDLISRQQGRILNIDVTLICEAPKIGPHRQQMIEAVTGHLGIDMHRVSIKATTTEKLGFTGRGEGIAAQAVASVELPKG